jgi:hypothetical protein
VPGNSLGEGEILSYDRRVKITMTVSFAPALSEAAKGAAERQGKSFDDWLAAAVEAKLQADEDAEILERARHNQRMRALGEYLDEWEAEHGAFTEEELAETAEEMGWGWPPAREPGKDET